MLIGLGVVLAATATPAPAQSTPTVYRIGVIETVPVSANAENFGAFRRGLAELGYVEGQNLTIEYRSDDRAERLAGLAAELVRLQVDVLVTRGSQAALAAKRATGTIPIVMATSGDPAAEGIVRRLARPEANVTGFHGMVPVELAGKRLQLLREIVPGASRVGIIWNPEDIQSPLLVRGTERAAQAMGVTLRSLEIPRCWGARCREAFDHVFEAAMMGQVDAVISVEDSPSFNNRARIVEFAAMSRLPAIYGLREFVDAGGLISYGTDRRDLFRRAAAYVDRILKGASPGDLPVSPPTKFELAINLKSARVLGLTIPPALRQRADYLVE